MLRPMIDVFFACLHLRFDQDLTKNWEIDDKHRQPNNTSDSKEKNIVNLPIYVSNKWISHLHDTTCSSVFNSRRF